MKPVRPIAKHRVRQPVAWVCAISLAMPHHMAYALPQGGQVAAGSATITSGVNATDINQASQRSVINWNGFEVGANESVNFYQPSQTAIALNRISGGASQINGSINANGQVCKRTRMRCSP